MVGSAIVRLLQKKDFDNLILRTRKELDLLDFDGVKNLFENEKPEIVILAAARVGGIQANINYPGQFLFENLGIQNNVIHASMLNSIKSLCFLGSSCIYPRSCPQPMKEDYLMTGPLEPTNEGYALAKITGLKLVEFYKKEYGLNGISLIPCNLYGTNDNFDPVNSHVLSSLVKKFVDAKHYGLSEVTLWGTGVARREFMHVDDAAAATLFLLENCEDENLVNVGWGKDISIGELAGIIADLVKFRGEIVWDHSKPDGMPRKCLDVSKQTDMGFRPKIGLSEGVEKTIVEYRRRKKEGLVV